MKRFITLILMLTILLTFTQKVTAFAPLLENETSSMVNCSMSMSSNELHMDMSKIDCGGDEMAHTIECQSDCHFMTMVSVLYFIEHNHTSSQLQSLLTYQTNINASPYYFPESLYRPPFLS
ncbi:hypothetical protein MT391_19205 [Vibrio sp. 1-Bac 57]